MNGRGAIRLPKSRYWRTRLVVLKSTPLNLKKFRWRWKVSNGRRRAMIGVFNRTNKERRQQLKEILKLLGKAPDEAIKAALNELDGPTAQRLVPFNLAESATICALCQARH